MAASNQKDQDQDHDHGQEVTVPSILGVLEEMLKTGDMFVKRAQQEKGIKSARMAFDIAERAFRFAFDKDHIAMALRAKARSPDGYLESITDCNSGITRLSARAFLKLFQMSGEITPRAQLYRDYVNFCQRQQLPWAGKGEFFGMLGDFELEVQKRKGIHKVTPKIKSRNGAK